MSEDEIIDTLKEIDVVDFYNTYTDSTTDFSEPRKYCDAIQGLLDLYKQEKEKNKELEENYDKLTQHFIENHISKDKIRAKIKEIKKMKEYYGRPDPFKNDSDYDVAVALGKVLELLEEE